MKHLSPIFAFTLVSASLTSIPAMAEDVRTVVPKENTCAAVTQAIHSMPDFAGTIKVELPAGEFLCDSPVIIDRDNTIVEGQGPARTMSVNDNTYRHVDSYGNKGYAYYIIGNFNGQSEMRPGTCDGNRIEDSVLTGAKQGVYIDHLCQGVVLKDVTIKEQSDSDCFYFRQGTHISVTGGSTCTDQNGNTKSIDGDYKSIDPQYQSAG